MPDYQQLSNGDPAEIIVRSIHSVHVTEERKPFINTDQGINHLYHAGTARANIAASTESPHGTTENDWATRHSHQTVLQQHCDFFDTDHDGILWPTDTFWGFLRLGFGIILSLVAVFIIHANFSYPTVPTWLPDPFFRLYITNIHKDKHGSDTNTYDTEGRFVPQKFEDIFEKYAEGRDYLTIWDVSNVMKGQRCIADPIGWGGALFEWMATYIMLWPDDGRMMKEDIRGIYDGSIFYTIAARRAQGKKHGS
ncbi:Caleosin-domain-containing protein [Trematosphaeria pertusa]|uniref:Caleosin-domain-containing protein n=1 Tax=Trematosphaeria pertusa TaxID=390896 RepID=A0A6A6INY5_9PLEO|nr:Caleosin-domain-containing protein [Trematosphaeria pertusa]KAF2252106.1 Caleosin-domain-containing protein [Trematosphaeria pertusa]